ncbi:uncharacterized protein BJX67DRAFT_354545 [Aspergillus lucknowensis]|uniref:Uncharacterized protein n=1 Tax=Aspergillus lucknowensis TaxID=176173 RepID=A0ABR4LQ59_9EURO
MGQIRVKRLIDATAACVPNMHTHPLLLFMSSGCGRPSGGKSPLLSFTDRVQWNTVLGRVVVKTQNMAGGIKPTV